MTIEEKEIKHTIHSKFYYKGNKVYKRTNNKQIGKRVTIWGKEYSYTTILWALHYNELVYKFYFLDGDPSNTQIENIIPRDRLDLETYIKTTFKYNYDLDHLVCIRDLNKYKRGDKVLGIPRTHTRRDGSKYTRYSIKCLDDTSVYTHRIVWFLCNGVWPKGVIDHIDQDPSNNSISNLRDVRHRENLLNRVDKAISPNICIIKGRNKKYRLRVGEVYKYFYTLDEAIDYRDSL